MHDGDSVVDIDWLVHAHVKALYDHVRWVYPTVDAASTVEDVFTQAALLIGSVPAEQARTWLYGLARKRIHDLNGDLSWRESNAAELVRSLADTAATMRDWHLWSETAQIIAATQQMRLQDQEILRLITCVDELDAERLAIILDLPVDAASLTLERVTTSFRAACDETNPSRDEGVNRD